jgi:hypothetical protein
MRPEHPEINLPPDGIIELLAERPGMGDIRSITITRKGDQEFTMLIHREGQYREFKINVQALEVESIDDMKYYRFWRNIADRISRTLDTLKPQAKGLDKKKPPYWKCNGALQILESLYKHMEGQDPANIAR